MENLVAIVLGIVIAVTLAALILRRGQGAAPAPDTALADSLRQRAEAETARATALEAQLREATARAALAEERQRRIAVLEDDARRLAAELQQARAGIAAAEKRAGETAAAAEQKEAALLDKIRLLEAAEQRLAKEFENLANRIFEQKQQQFGERSKENLDALLKPFREQIEGFRQKVEQVYGEEQRERHVLKHEIDALRKLNQQITQEAANLTRALKSDNKAQGNWGEMVLERILESSGLHEGREYHSQKGLRHEEGKRHITDVVVHLPEGKDVIIDSKVSLIDWERYTSAADDDARAEALEGHVASLRNHVKLLGDKDYQNLEGVQSLDYVLVFVPIEGAFHAAIAADGKLVDFALSKNIMLVSPTTLLIALRTIYNLWRYEYQNRNALEIARVAGSMHDKLAAFVADMNDIRKALDKAGESWTAAHNKLASGKGNVIRQAERVATLGAKTAKKIDQGWTGLDAEGAAGDGDDEPA